MFVSSSPPFSSSTPPPLHTCTLTHSLTHMPLQPTSRWERFKEWVRNNPKKTVLFAVLIALGLALLILLPMALALLPLLNASVGRSSTFNVTDLCSNNATYGFQGSLLIPGSVTVVVTRAFTVKLLQNDTLFAEMDIPGPITLNPGEVPVRFGRTQPLRVVNETQLAIMIQSAINGAPGTVLTLKLALPVKIYGGISLTFPITYHLDFAKLAAANSTTTTTTNNTTATNATKTSVSLSSVEVPQSDVNAFVARLGLDVVGSTPLLVADVPALSFDVRNPDGVHLATVGNSAFTLNGPEMSSAKVGVLFCSSFLSFLIPSPPPPHPNRPIFLLHLKTLDPSSNKSPQHRHQTVLTFKFKGDHQQIQLAWQIGYCLKSKHDFLSPLAEEALLLVLLRPPARH